MIVVRTGWPGTPSSARAWRSSSSAEALWGHSAMTRSSTSILAIVTPGQAAATGRSRGTLPAANAGYGTVAARDGVFRTGPRRGDRGSVRASMPTDCSGRGGARGLSEWKRFRAGRLVGLVAGLVRAGRVGVDPAWWVGGQVGTQVAQPVLRFVARRGAVPFGSSRSGGSCMVVIAGHAPIVGGRKGRADDTGVAPGVGVGRLAGSPERAVAAGAGAAEA